MSVYQLDILSPLRFREKNSRIQEFKLLSVRKKACVTKSELRRAPLMPVGGCCSALCAESSLVTLGVTQLMFSADVDVMRKEVVAAARNQLRDVGVVTAAHWETA